MRQTELVPQSASVGVCILSDARISFDQDADDAVACKEHHAAVTARVFDPVLPIMTAHPKQEERGTQHGRERAENIKDLSHAITKVAGCPAVGPGGRPMGRSPPSIVLWSAGQRADRETDNSNPSERRGGTA